MVMGVSEMNKILRTCLATALLGAGGLSLRAQSTYGTILGTVKDKSGAMIPNQGLRP
jgi:hypothetical protein